MLLSYTTSISLPKQPPILTRNISNSALLTRNIPYSVPPLLTRNIPHSCAPLTHQEYPPVCTPYSPGISPTACPPSHQEYLLHHTHQEYPLQRTPLLTRNISYSVPLPAEPGYQHLIVLLNEIETSIIGDESCDLLPVLDELHSNALADGRVRLLGFNTTARKEKGIQ